MRGIGTMIGAMMARRAAQRGVAQRGTSAFDGSAPR